MTEALLSLCLMAVAAGTVAMAITMSHITAPLRYAYIDAPFMIGELINCAYCMAFWTAIPPAIAYGGGIAIVVNWLIITGLSHLFIGILLRLFLFREKENEDLRELVREARETINDLMGDRK